MTFPSFESAVEQMRAFLAEEAKPTRISWIFRDDLFLTRVDRAIVRYPPPAINESLARKVYEEGRSRGFVEVSAIAASADETFVTVWCPRSRDEEADAWNDGTRMSIANPLARASLVGSRIAWSLWRKMPSYRRYQRDAEFIGTRAWASEAD